MTKSKEEKKSQIGGNGYGDSHIWIRENTIQGGFGETLNYSQKATAYRCHNCKTGFIHAYDITPNIFEAIKNAGVVDKCLINHDKK